VPRKLTIREEEILKLICEGWERREIAEMMGLSHHTIGNHWKSIQDKTDCHKVALLVLWAVVHGVIDPHKTSLSRALLPVKTRQNGKIGRWQENISFPR